jgi:gliding motility-associated-like protein
VTLQPPVPAFAGRDTIAQINYPLQLNASGGDSYEWSPANFFSNPGISNPFITIQNDQLFTLIVTAGGHCLGYDTVFVRTYLDSGYYVPTSFTPNGDGLNDVLRVLGTNIRSVDFLVYNRWGQKIFESRDQRKGWNGKYKYKEQPGTTYVYYVRAVLLDGKVIVKKGNTILLR